MAFGAIRILAALLIAAAPQTTSPLLLRGIVRDQTGAVLQSARIELLDATGALLQGTTTDARGEFTFAALAPGAYQLRAEFEGFKPTLVKVRIVARRAPPPQTLTLDLASVPQEVTVNSGAGALATSAPANKDAIVVDNSALRDLPIFDNDIVGTLSRFLDASAIGTGGVTLVVDGMEAQRVGVPPSAIQQIKVNQDPYSAEFPRPGRGRIEVITKAGADAYSGSGDFTFRDARLNARNPFSATKPPEERRIADGLFAGPVGDGKHTSFMFTADRADEDLQSVVVAEGLQGPINGVVSAPDRHLELSGTLNHQQGTSTTWQVRLSGESNSTQSQGVGGTTLPEAAVDDRGDEEQAVVGARTIVTKRLLNEFRLLVGREVTSTVSLHPGERIVVLDAFTGGGAQADQATTEYHAQLTDNLTFARGKQVIKGGIAVPDWSRRGYDDRTNRDGTFTFGSLADYAAGHPLSFVQQQGDGRLVFLQKVFGAFIQDEITLNDRVTVTPGLRYDWQNIIADANNVAPRLSGAIALDKNTVVRGGAGIFYDRVGDNPIREVLRSRGEKLVRLIVTDPSYPDPFASGTLATAVPSIVTLAPDVQIPYTLQFSAGVEHQIRKGTAISVTYLGSRGYHLFRSHDINAPLPPLYAARPNAAFGQIRQIESTGRQIAHSVQVTARGRVAPHLQGTLQYTLATAHNDTSGIDSLPANNYDLSSEWGRADFDQRHHLEGLLQYKAGAWVNVGAAVSLSSGRPYSLTTGTDPYNTGQTNARPAGVARNTLEGPGYASVDLRWSHDFDIGRTKPGRDPSAFNVGVDAFNVLNRVNYAAYIGTLTSPFFGQAIAARPPRQIQLTAGFRF